MCVVLIPLRAHLFSSYSTECLWGSVRSVYSGWAKTSTSPSPATSGISLQLSALHQPLSGRPCASLFPRTLSTAQIPAASAASPLLSASLSKQWGAVLGLGSISQGHIWDGFPRQNTGANLGSPCVLIYPQVSLSYIVRQPMPKNSSFTFCRVV